MPGLREFFASRSSASRAAMVAGPPRSSRRRPPPRRARGRRRAPPRRVPASARCGCRVPPPGAPGRPPPPRRARSRPALLAVRRAGAPISKVTAKSVTYSRATLSRSAASPIASRRVTVGGWRRPRRRTAQAAGPRPPDGGVDLRGVGHGRVGQHAAQPLPQASARETRGPRQRREQQDDAEIGVATGSSGPWPPPRAGWWRPAAARPPRRAPARWRRRSPGSPRSACRESDARATRCPASGRSLPAGRRAGPRRRPRPACHPRPEASWSTSAPATSSPVASCRPCQPGMPFTSST